MIGSDIYVFWKNSTGECVVSRRKINAYAMPVLSEHQNSSIVEPKQSTDKILCSISRPYSDIPTLGDSTRFIWAIGGGVSRPDESDSSFSSHIKKGRLDTTTSLLKRESPNSKATVRYRSNSWSDFQNSKLFDHIERVILMFILFLG
jgi:hypothetical protein